MSSSRPGEPTEAATEPTWADLTPEVVADALPTRPVRVYPALLSTEADAMAWARQGAEAGAIVVADYQASPRGRGGLPWEVRPGHGLGFSLILRPDLATERDGWLYTVTTCALAEVVEGDPPPEIHWPDEVTSGQARAAATGVHTEHGASGLDFVVVTVLIEDVAPPRAPLLARTVPAIEHRLAQAPQRVVDEHAARCVTLGRQVTAHLVPLGPAGTRIEGEAVGTRADGSLAIQTGPGRRIAIPPRDLGRLDEH